MKLFLATLFAITMSISLFSTGLGQAQSSNYDNNNFTASLNRTSMEAEIPNSITIPVEMGYVNGNIS